MKFDFNRFLNMFSRKEGKPNGIELPQGSPFSLSEDGKSILFGRYPQTLKADHEKISPTPNADGFYTLSNGTPVERFVVTNDVTLDGGRKLKAGDSYYFKLDPVEWEILSSGGNEAFLISKLILDAKAFNDADTKIGERKDSNGYEMRMTYSELGVIPANNWEVSTLREWLNWDFKSICFNEEELERLLTIERGDSVVKGETYSDDVTLLSIEEAQDSAYGFKSADVKDAKRSISCTDFSRANGLETAEVSRSIKGVWWLRSAGFTTYNASRVYFDGYLNESGKRTDNKGFGVRPVIKVRF